MKKLISILLSLVMLLSFASCTQNESSQTDDLEAVLAQKEAEINLLNQQLTSKETEISQLKERAEKAEGDLNEKDTAYTQIQNKIEDYEEYFSLLDGYYGNQYKSGGYYEDGSITLVSIEEQEYPFSSNFKRKYRYTYYLNRLPLDRALAIVRGENYVKPTREDFYTSQDVPVQLVPDFVYLLQEAKIEGLHGLIKGEPIMHSYMQWILNNAVSVDEMMEVVEILSNINHSVYDDWMYSREEIDFTHEYYELPNVNILYTFDADIINEYYRYA